MEFLVGTITRCQGQQHYHIPVTVAGETAEITVLQEEINVDFTRDEARDKMVDRMRSARKEANAQTFAATKTALEGKVFEI